MSDQFVLVTGASSGIGLALAEELAGRGYDLAICSESDRLQNAAHRLEGFGAQVYVWQENLATREGVARLWKKVENVGRDLDIACINAGVGVGGLFAETDLDAELNMIELNCSGAVQLAKYVVRHMSSRNRGRISTRPRKRLAFPSRIASATNSATPAFP